MFSNKKKESEERQTSPRHKIMNGQHTLKQKISIRKTRIFKRVKILDPLDGSTIKHPRKIKT